MSLCDERMPENNLEWQSTSEAFRNGGVAIGDKKFSALLLLHHHKILLHNRVERGDEELRILFGENHRRFDF